MGIQIFSLNEPYLYIPRFPIEIQQNDSTLHILFNI